MHTITHTDESESPTRPILNLRSPVLTALTRIERHAELAIERLGIDPDQDTVLAALEDLAAIRRLCQGALR